MFLTQEKRKKWLFRKVEEKKVIYSEQITIFFPHFFCVNNHFFTSYPHKGIKQIKDITDIS